MVPSARLADVPADQPAAGPVLAGTGKGAARSRSPPGAPRSRSREFLWRAPARSVRPSMPGGGRPVLFVKGAASETLPPRRWSWGKRGRERAQELKTQKPSGPATPQAVPGFGRGGVSQQQTSWPKGLVGMVTGRETGCPGLNHRPCAAMHRERFARACVRLTPRASDSLGGSGQELSFPSGAEGRRLAQMLLKSNPTATSAHLSVKPHPGEALCMCDSAGRTGGGACGRLSACVPGPTADFPHPGGIVKSRENVHPCLRNCSWEQSSAHATGREGPAVHRGSSHQCVVLCVCVTVTK